MRGYDIGMNKKTKDIFTELKQNYKIIEKTYNLLEKTQDLGIDIHPAGMWILDNMYIIEEQYTGILKQQRSIKKIDLPVIKFKNSGGRVVGIYYLATELVENNKGYIDSNIILNRLVSHQKHSYLTSDELFLFPLMVKIGIIKFITRICLNITNSQIQKLRVNELLSKEVSEDLNVINKNKLKIQESYNYDLEKISKLFYKELKAFKNDKEITEKLKYTNTAFVEYLAATLKQNGSTLDNIYDTLNEEANKIGFSVEEAIVKEHMEIAKTSEYIGKAINGLKQVEGINYLKIFELVNKVDEILLDDYTKEFSKCDYKTKSRYRDRIVFLSKKYKLSEIYVAKKAIECSHEYKKHVGFFLSGDDKYLLNKKINKSYTFETINTKALKPIKPYLYVFSLMLMAALATFNINLCSTNYLNYDMNLIINIFVFAFMFELFEKLINYLVMKTIKPKILPRFDFAKTIPEEYSTYVVMPTVISSFKKIDDMIKKMEVTYLANRSENMYYMLLGDCTGSKNQVEDVDIKYVEYAKEKLDILNEKHKRPHKMFNFIYRKRIYSESEKCYMGWERKRGAIEHFNKLILGKLSEKQKDEFMYIVYDDVVKTKFAITIDEDTELSLNTAKDLVGIISHPLNEPKLSESGRYVKSGHGLITPSIGLDIESANSSIFSKIFGGFGGLDMYTLAVSNTYQDLFNESIFCGKGIYNIELFEQLLSKEIPENLVLSHDLLEGSYLRAGLASDIQVQDDFPSNYIAYSKRNHRWYRGDVQILKWLSFKSPINFLSKFKIFDNIRRPLTFLLGYIAIILSLIIEPSIFIYVCTLVFIGLSFGYILGIIDVMIYGKKKYEKEMLYIPIIHGISATLLNMMYEFITLPYKSYMFVNAVCKSLYRMFISKSKLLEWTTAETLSKSAKNTLTYYYANMIINVITAIIIYLAIYFNDMDVSIKILSFIMGTFFLIAPSIAYLLGKDYLFNNKKKLDKKEKEEILEIGLRTWKFFDKHMTDINNYLVTDNYQETRRTKFVNRTSSTNIGMQCLAITNAYDLKFIEKQECITKLNNLIDTINKLEKWNGHLYNWYDIKTLQPLRPRFVSTVDSGNFIASLYVVKEFLKELLKDETEENKEIIYIINKNVEILSNIIRYTDFTKLYNSEQNLFSIGYYTEENKLIDSYYDMLMSENRTTSFVAIASKQITSKHWFALSRKMVKSDGYKGLTSWSGTAFEYYMPQIFFKSYKHTLIDQSLFFARYMQRKFAKRFNIAWGVSESAYFVMDNDLNYQYKAFGIPELGLKRGLKDFVVTAPYGSILMLEFDEVSVYNNIKKLKNIGAYGSYGFYESIDYTKKHMINNDYEVIKTYMAHHQGMILSSINNYLNDGIIRERFHNIARMKATEILLKERERNTIDIVKDKSIFKPKEKNKLKVDYSMFVSNKHIDSKYIEHMNNELDIALLRGNDTSVILTSNGGTYLKFKNKIVNKQRYKDISESLNSIYITDKTTNQTYNISSVESIKNNETIETSNFYVALNDVQYDIATKDLEINNKIFLSPENSSMINKVSVYNSSNQSKEIEIVTYIEPALTDYMTSVVHPSFNNLQIETIYDKELDSIIAMKRLKNEQDTEIYMYSKLLGIDLEKGIETERSKMGTSKSHDLNVSKYPLWPVLSYKAKIILEPFEKQTFYYVVGIEESKYKLTTGITNLTIEDVEKESRLALELNTITSRYLKLKENEAYAYNKIIYKMLFKSKMIDDKYWDSSLNQSMLWKFGISGDLPILLVNITSVEHMRMIENVLSFVDYIKNRNLDIDIIILNSDDKYPEKVFDYVAKKISNTNFINTSLGNIYNYRLDNLDSEDVKLFKFVAKEEVFNVDEFLPKSNEEEKSLNKKA